MMMMHLIKLDKLVADSNIRDYNELYRALFENLDSFHNPVLGTIIIAESQYQSALAPDKEITFMACIAKFIKTILMEQPHNELRFIQNNCY
jgi:hypothetical protein